MTYAPKTSVTDENDVTTIYSRPKRTIDLSDTLYDLLHEGAPLNDPNPGNETPLLKFEVAPHVEERVFENLSIRQLNDILVEIKDRQRQMQALMTSLDDLSHKLQNPLGLPEGGN